MWKPDPEAVETVRGHDAPVTASVWPERGGKYAVTGSSDGIIKLWNIRDISQDLQAAYTVKVSCIEDSN